MLLSTRALVLGLTLGIAGCAAGGDAREKQLDELKSTVTKLRADQAAMLERLEAMELRGGERGAAAMAAGRGQPDLETVRLSPPVADPNEDPNDPSARPVITANARSSSLDDKHRTQGPDKDYAAAMGLFKDKKADKAMTALSGFLSRYPDHPKAENVTFARAELFANKGDHRRAIEQYEALVTRWPTGAKAPDALLRAAQSYTRLGDKGSADEVKKRLATGYPDSDAAKKLGRVPSGAASGAHASGANR